MARDTAPVSELTCPRCHRIGCDCDQKVDICNACRRNKVACICAAAPVLTEPLIEDARLIRSDRVWTQATIDDLVKQAYRHYYWERDWASIERLIRGIFV
jgi:hypothetical protein